MSLPNSRGNTAGNWPKRRAKPLPILPDPWRTGRRETPCSSSSWNNRQDCLSYNATRCRYAELYQSLGLTELGRILSCSRDEPLLEGFNPQISFVRSQTILEGAPFCDFRLVLKPAKKERSRTKQSRHQP